MSYLPRKARKINFLWLSTPVFLLFCSGLCSIGFGEVHVRLSLHTSQVARQAGAYPGFRSMKRLGVFLLLLEASLFRQKRRKIKPGDLGGRLGCGLLGIDLFLRNSVVHQKVGSLKAVPPKQVWWFSNLFHLTIPVGYFWVTLCFCFNTSPCKTFHMKLSLICTKKETTGEHIFIWIVLDEDSFWRRGKRQLGTKCIA